MTRPRRRLLLASGALAALLAFAGLVLWLMLPSDEQLARRVEAAFEQRFGQPLVVGAARWRVLGVPVVELRDVHTQPQTQREREQPDDDAIRVRRVAVYPALWPLLRQRLVIHRLEVEGATVSRQALARYRNQTADGQDRTELVLHRLRFSDVSYTSYSGVAVAYQGEVDFDADGLPRRVQVQRPGVQPPATLDATRDGQADNGAHVYRLRLQAAGGAAQGQARLLTAASGEMTLSGELAPRGVEVQALLEAFNRRSPVSGVASGETTLHAQGEAVAELVRSLRTRSVLRVERARILRFDIDKAVQSLGQDPAGETALDSLTGVMQTQNTEQGLKTVFTEVHAVAGSYTAEGRATLHRRRLDAQGRLQLAGGVVDVPFAVHGPTRQPSVELAWGSVAGAAVGTAVMPGIGTVLGAKIGGVISGPPETPAARERREQHERAHR